ncbi:MAG: DNA polymerase III subunit epsilon, partial [Chloroflexi bacterium]
MADTLVALDLETTGLDPTRDAIIQIGAVKFRGARIEDEYETLVNPGVPIPGFITELTGITDAMVVRAPVLAAALPELLRFVGNAPVIGHNLKFDLGFLQKHGALRNNVSIDTYDLASALLPSASRYALGALAAELGVPLRDAHRALNDARATQAVYMLLAQRAEELSLDTLSELVRLAADVEWGADYTFQEALRRRTEQGAAPKRRRSGAPERGLFAGSGGTAGPALQPADEPAPLDEAPLVEMFKPGGALAGQFASYESRPQQLKMMRAVARALSGQRHLLVEAGTGTGKSLAYLVPAICWAVQSDWRVVISTNTINLQDQLMRKDLPALQQALPQDFRAAVLKGRGNYVCPRLFDAMRRRPVRTLDEMRV